MIHPPPAETAEPESLTQEVWVDLLNKQSPFSEHLAGWVVRSVAAGIIFLVFLIFVFLAKESFPVAMGQVTTARGGSSLPVEDALKLPPDQLAAYLGQAPDAVAALDGEMRKALVELRNKELQATPNPDTLVNAASWENLLLPYAWNGQKESSFIWQPNSVAPKFNIVPLLLGSLKISLVAILVAVPLSIAAAIYVALLARSWVREWIKPVIELLAGFPTVVLGFFGLLVAASVLQNTMGYEFRLNAFIAGLVTALAIIPVVFTIAEDALAAVPHSHRFAAYALGASKWHSAIHVITPVALPGIFAAALLGFSRALGETMIALMVSGNASVMGWSLFDSARTIPATIGAELAEAPVGGIHYEVLFLIGLILFLICFFINAAGDWVILRLKQWLEGVASAEQYNLTSDE